MEGATANQHMRQPPRLERADIASRDIAVEAAKPSEQDADVPGFDRDGPTVLLHRPAAFLHQPGNKGRNRIRKRLINSEISDLSILVVRSRNRQSDDCRLRRRLMPPRLEQQ